MNCSSNLNFQLTKKVEWFYLRSYSIRGPLSKKYGIAKVKFSVGFLKRIKNPTKHLRWSISQKQLTCGSKFPREIFRSEIFAKFISAILVTIFAKISEIGRITKIILRNSIRLCVCVCVCVCVLLRLNSLDENRYTFYAIHFIIFLPCDLPKSVHRENKFRKIHNKSNRESEFRKTLSFWTCQS